VEDDECPAADEHHQQRPSPTPERPPTCPQRADREWHLWNAARPLCREPLVGARDGTGIETCRERRQVGTRTADEQVPRRVTQLVAVTHEVLEKPIQLAGGVAPRRWIHVQLPDHRSNCARDVHGQVVGDRLRRPARQRAGLRLTKRVHAIEVRPELPFFEHTPRELAIAFADRTRRRIVHPRHAESSEVAEQDDPGSAGDAVHAASGVEREPWCKQRHVQSRPRSEHAEALARRLAGGKRTRRDQKRHHDLHRRTTQHARCGRHRDADDGRHRSPRRDRERGRDADRGDRRRLRQRIASRHEHVGVERRPYSGNDRRYATSNAQHGDREEHRRERTDGVLDGEDRSRARPGGSDDQRQQRGVARRAVRHDRRCSAVEHLERPADVGRAVGREHERERPEIDAANQQADDHDHRDDATGLGRQHPPEPPARHRGRYISTMVLNPP
jgi:hypothetical protein